MRDLIWLPEARAQLADAFTFIASQNVTAADRLVSLIEERVDTLRSLPFIGRPGRVPDTRELIVHPNYIVI